MQESYDFGIDFNTYAKRGKNNRFPDHESCPMCHSRKRLHRHGFYWRYGITDLLIERVPICRFLCTICKKTLSILPSFFVPYFQHTICTILIRLEERICHQQIKGSRQLVSYYVNRFMGQLNWLHTFFIDQVGGFEIGKTEKEKATKYMKMIRDFGESTFFRRSKGHLSSYFMAPPLYHEQIILGQGDN